MTQNGCDRTPLPAFQHNRHKLHYDDCLNSYNRVSCFPGRWGRGHICPESADAILRAAFKRLGIEGASTHSFRRTAITWMHNARVPIKHIQSISGYKSLSALQRYIDVTEKDKEMAIATLGFRL